VARSRAGAGGGRRGRRDLYRWSPVPPDEAAAAGSSRRPSRPGTAGRRCRSRWSAGRQRGHRLHAVLEPGLLGVAGSEADARHVRDRLHLAEPGRDQTGEHRDERLMLTPRLRVWQVGRCACTPMRGTSGHGMRCCGSARASMASCARTARRRPQPADSVRFSITAADWPRSGCAWTSWLAGISSADEPGDVCARP